MRLVVALLLFPGCFTDSMIEDVDDTTGQETGSNSTSMQPLTSTSSMPTSSSTSTGPSSTSETASSEDGSTSDQAGTSSSDELGSATSDGSSSESTGDPLAHEGVYEFCYEGNEVNCSGSQVTACVYGSALPGGAAGFCSEPCEVDADCIEPADSEAEPMCTDSCGVKNCWLRCLDYECPDGWTCSHFTAEGCATQVQYVCIPDP